MLVCDWLLFIQFFFHLMTDDMLSWLISAEFRSNLCCLLNCILIVLDEETFHINWLSILHENCFSYFNKDCFTFLFLIYSVVLEVMNFRKFSKYMEPILEPLIRKVVCNYFCSLIFLLILFLGLIMDFWDFTFKITILERNQINTTSC